MWQKQVVWGMDVAETGRAGMNVAEIRRAGHAMHVAEIRCVGHECGRNKASGA